MSSETWPWVLVLAVAAGSAWLGYRLRGTVAWLLALRWYVIVGTLLLLLPLLSRPSLLPTLATGPGIALLVLAFLPAGVVAGWVSDGFRWGHDVDDPTVPAAPIVPAGIPNRSLRMLIAGTIYVIGYAVLSAAAIVQGSRLLGDLWMLWAVVVPVLFAFWLRLTLWPWAAAIAGFLTGTVVTAGLGAAFGLQVFPNHVFPRAALNPLFCFGLGVFTWLLTLLAVHLGRIVVGFATRRDR